MKIALLGYGRMGKAIEKIALDRGHSIALIVNGKDDKFDLTGCDVAIDFSLPKAAVTNIKSALDQNTPVISGTTGWLEHFEAVTSFCDVKEGAFLYASNFSLGVNLFFELLNSYVFF